MRAFIDRFSRLGQKETRVVTVLDKGDHGSLPQDRLLLWTHIATTKIVIAGGS